MMWNKIGMLMKRIGKDLLIGVPVAVTFLDTFGYVARVDGISMQPALNPEGQPKNDFVLLNKWSIRNYEINHGDIVALKCPRDPDQKLIKRVVAVEGETLKKATKNDYVSIPVGHCWVEGDHLRHSMDSNFFGPVPKGLIFAKASHIVWPPSRWQRLESQVPENRHSYHYALIPWYDEDD